LEQTRKQFRGSRLCALARDQAGKGGDGNRRQYGGNGNGDEQLNHGEPGGTAA
jgi:hypothetical protein